MTDNAIILETLKFINKETRYNPFVNINTTIWKDYNINKQEALRRLLFKRKLVNQNMDNQWEFRLTTEGDLAIEVGDEELERDFLKFISKQSNIEWFMVNNFIKPDPECTKTINETDEGVIFLKKLKSEGLVEYDKGALSHVNDWHVDGGDNPKIKRWFDTLHEPLLVTQVNKRLPLRLSKRKFVLKQIRYATRNGIKYGARLSIGIWKFIVLVIATFLGGWLALDHNFMDVINWIKNYFSI